MSYLILARKFRPQTFDEIVGQEPIVTTLKNAIAQNRVAQSFLFTGMRGVGKTSTARILAKSLNCAKGPSVTPCNRCSACLEITAGNSLDVLEIDGASNRGIDEIRNLRETVKFKPTQGHFRIYIIDEVHMLTAEAFNALLKTLEEPPEHVKFIFATTEVHKVPATILSRCQRFDFRRIPTATIAETLRAIAKKEKLDVEKEVFFVLAKAAEGSLRDGESLLDKMASSTKETIRLAPALEALGLVSQEAYFSMVDAAAQNDSAKMLETLEELARAGKDLTTFLQGLIETFRHLLIAETVSRPEELIDLPEEALAEVLKRKGRFSTEDLLYVLTLLQTALIRLRRAATPRFIVELALAKIASRTKLVSLAELVERLEALEKKPNGTAPSNPSSASALQFPQTPPRRAVVPAEIPEPRRQAPVGDAKKPPLPRVSNPNDEKAANDSAASASAGEVSLSVVQSVWPRVIELVKAKKVSTGIFLSEAEPMEIEGGRLTIAFPQEFSFHKETIEKKENRALVEQAFAQQLGRPVRLRCVVSQVQREEKAVPASTEIPEIVESAIELFQGKIIRR